MFSFILVVTIISFFLIVYHHLLYPLLLRFIKGHSEKSVQPMKRRYQTSSMDSELPTITVVVPAYNEAEYIADKIQNLAIMDYPTDKLKCIIACDGCTDRTYDIAMHTANLPECQDLSIEIRNYSENRGKVAVLNELMLDVNTELVALSDTSAILSWDALLVCAEHFKDKRVGVVNGEYRLLKPGSEGEEKYWDYQKKIKLCEASMGSSIGSHGAFYMVRAALMECLPSDTINDDFVIPMRIVGLGYKAVYEPEIRSLELDETSQDLEEGRRQRIGAGNIQQLLRLKHLLLPRYKGVAFNFFSGKALRTVMPFVLLVSLIGSAYLSTQFLFLVLFLSQLAVYGGCYMVHMRKVTIKFRLFNYIYYIVQGYTLSLLGMLRYIKTCIIPFRKAESNGPTNIFKVLRSNCSGFLFRYNPSAVRILKRLFDIFFSLVLGSVALPLIPFIIIAIKLDSKGPIFYSQTRIGYASKHKTLLFDMIKFRTMYQNAEKNSGAVWATKNDSRITTIGSVLRKIRFDEIPQLYNVLVGDMSLVGPRPERPGFYSKLESEIPYFADRTYGVMPGITGLAQVNQGYDTSIDDVRSKVGFDHSYALSLMSVSSWLKNDISILFKTIFVMLLGRGQ